MRSQGCQGRASFKSQRRGINPQELAAVLGHGRSNQQNNQEELIPTDRRRGETRRRTGTVVLGQSTKQCATWAPE
jgi:hypothetical protein